MKKPKTPSQNPYMQMPYGGYGYPAYQQPSQVQGAFQAPQQFPPIGTGAPQAPGGMLPLEESYIENILRLNKGKVATVYMTFEGNNQKVFKGVIEAAGRDHIVLSDPQTGKRYILLMVYLDYVTFDEEIEYTYPFNGMGQQPLSSYSPR
ncbi:spore coat protein GerQ [Priestia abyssalis]|uniref:spore coat protein GerQ n=1 Tax=Priestia abyssalis TaxID=1221450 RepID=UPI0009953961|nr:spore coat protein GerQ [Priestia abyssalis]